MTPAEAQMLLGIAASFDNRKPSEEAAIAWAAVLGDLEFTACRDAIVRHYRESREWIMPADVVSGVRLIAAERMRPFGLLVPPASIQGDPAEERKWRLWARDEIMSGRATKPADIGMDDGSGYPVRDVQALLGIPADDVRGMRNPKPVGELTDSTTNVARLRALIGTSGEGEDERSEGSAE